MPRYPLTPGQRLIWTGQSLSQDEPLYNMAWRYELKHQLDPNVFSQAFQALIAKTDILRMRILSTDGEPEIQISDSENNTFEVIDITGFPDPVQAADDWITKRLKAPLIIEKKTWESALLILADAHFIWYLNQHHIVTDGAAASILAGHLYTLYARLAAGQPIADYIVPQYSSFVQSIVTKQKTYSEQGLEPVEPRWFAYQSTLLPMSKLYGRTSHKSSTPAIRINVPLDKTQSGALDLLANDPGVRAFSSDLSFHTILETVLVAYIARVSGDETITLGTAVNTRSSPEQRKTPGMFLQLIPTRVEYLPGDTFRSLYQRVAQELQAGFGDVRVENASADSQRLFNVIFNYINAVPPLFGEQSWSAQWLDSGHIDPRHHMRLSVVKSGPKHIGSLCFDFNRAVFDDAQALTAKEHFLNLLNSCLKAPDNNLSEISLVNQVERDRITKGPDPEILVGPTETILDDFLKQVSQSPNALALQCEDAVLTYAELEAKSADIACGLIVLGIRPKDHICIKMRRSISQAIAIFGVLRAGCTYVPIEPGHPDERTRSMLSDANISLSIVDNLEDQSRKSGQHNTTTIQHLYALNAEHKPECELPVIRSNDLAYIIFTSGSTGRAKGVAVSHQSLASYVRWAQITYSDGKPVDMPLCTSIGVDLTVTSIYLPLTSGGCVKIYPEAHVGADLAIVDVFEDDMSDIVKLTPGHLALIAQTAPNIRRIKKLIAGGEDLKTSLAKQIHDLFNGRVSVFNEYGPTEAVVGCMVHEFNPEIDSALSVPLGRAAKDAKIYTLDAGLNPVPDGVLGEIFIGGRLADGYVNLPEATAEKFIANPFEDGQTLYKSGDLARKLPSGNFVYHGRVDRQIKLKGIRIEPTEIERVLLMHDAVMECVIELQSRQSGVSQLQNCLKCGLGDDYPGIKYNADGVCSVCSEYAENKARADLFWQPMAKFSQHLEDAKAQAAGAYDCITLLSGGKDSVYALYRVAAFGPRILALTLDNGFISESSKENIERVADHLNVDHRFMSTPAMNEIFVDSLKRRADVCPGCFKTIYTLALQVAADEGIPLIITGLSRGQLFDTRISLESLKVDEFTPEDFDRRVLSARKRYHRVDDAVFRNLDVSCLQSGERLDQIPIVDFYRYCDVELTEVLLFLQNKTPWKRPSDTGRSTNCLINDVGIFVHQQTRGFHNYAYPYSWDVRLGHKTRDAALDELDDDIDMGKVSEILATIGYDEAEVRASEAPKLCAFFTATKPVDMNELREIASAHLPPVMIPRHFVQIESIPLTKSGKVDYEKLPAPLVTNGQTDAEPALPENELEQLLSDLWSKALKVPCNSVLENYFDLGGDSISAIRIEAWAFEAGVDFDALGIFEHQTIRALANSIKQDAS